MTWSEWRYTDGSTPSEGITRLMADLAGCALADGAKQVEVGVTTRATAQMSEQTRKAIGIAVADTQIVVVQHGNFTGVLQRQGL